MDLLIYLILFILVLTVLYGVYILARVTPEWLRVPGRAIWLHKGGGRVEVNQDNDAREQFVAMYRTSSRKGHPDGLQNFEALSDAQVCVGVNHRRIEQKFRARFKWASILLVYIGAGISYYLTLLAYLPIENMTGEEVGWYKLVSLVVLAIMVPAVIIWKKRQELKFLWKGVDDGTFPK